MKRILQRTLIALFSAGWLFPLWLSGHIFLDFIVLEVQPRLSGNPKVNSFPFLHYSLSMWTLSCAWLGLVLIYWVI